MEKQKKDYAKSFISEHSAEYILVPKMKSILQKEYDFVTPIYASLKREGSKIAWNIHKGEFFKVVGIYPRRPKLVYPPNSITTIKINHEISRGAKRGNELGIPIIAGCPLVNNFWELGKNPKCLWLKIDQGNNDDIELKIETYNIRLYANEESNYIFKNEKSLLVYLTEKVKLLNFNEVMLAFREIKNAYWGYEQRGFWGLASSYKPVYFLLR